ncbi:MAG TPA: cytochrome P450 [Ktedonobacteraceae bacterium]|jgi:cytochrome P450
MPNKLSTLQGVQEEYAWFQSMRDTHPVWLDENSKCWHVFRFADVNTVITDYAVFSSVPRTPDRPQPEPSEHAQLQQEAQNKRRRGLGQTLLQMDPPQHRKYRNLVSPSFTPRALGRMSERIGVITQELLDQIRPLGHIDFVPDFAYPLPTIVIAEMLGVPTSDRPLFKTWADGLLDFQLSDAEAMQARESVQSQSVQPQKQDPRDNPEMQRMRRLMDEMSDYFEATLEDRRREPRNDMMSELLVAEVDGERLSMDDLIGFCILLLLAGHITTTNLLSQAVRCFSEHPDALAQVREHPELIPGATEEVLRYASPVWRTARTTKTDVTLEGVTIPANSLVFAWLASANRDERQFPEPERFDVTRDPNHHLAFGHGIHFCLGAPLSRLEASIALPMLIKQLPDLHVISEESMKLYAGTILFGFKSLPVAFTASKPAKA